MDTIKNAVGLGKESQEGQEPVSGQQGEGTAVEPFDAGNQEDNSELGGKAPQQTDPAKVSGNIAETASGGDASTGADKQ
ncbi:hypothetical protein LTR85_004291 [Meristemomyces frigidus]|nr:hypothetical protein LTR85_004291 [Meristemomyces frigidus]